MSTIKNTSEEKKLRKNVKLTVILFGLILLASFAACVRPVKAQFQGDVTINVDGSVTPSSAPFFQSGNTYSLTSDINGSITVNRSNIVLEGNKHTIMVNSIFTSGITLNNTANSTVINFSVIGGQYGINVYGTLNVVSDNSISSVNNEIYSLDKPTGGIALTGTSNSILRNSLQGNLVGVNFFGGSPLNCSYNLIVGNTFTDCSTAILLYDSPNNTLYHNRFFNNEKTVYDSGLANYPQTVSLNIWDNGYPSGGNYWGDYVAKYPNAKTIDNSGLGDTAYLVETQNEDRYPIINLNQFYNFQLSTPKVAVMSPTNQSYNESSIPLTFTLDKPASWIGYSLDGHQNISVAGNTTLAILTGGLHGLRVYANDTFGNVGASQQIDFTVILLTDIKPEPFPTTIISAVTIVVMLAMAAGLLVYHKKHKAKSG